MTSEQHEIEVEKLFELEKELSNLIAEQDNDELSDLFLKWMDQRSVCNKGFFNFMEAQLEKHKRVDNPND